MLQIRPKRFFLALSALVFWFLAAACSGPEPGDEDGGGDGDGDGDRDGGQICDGHVDDDGNGDGDANIEEVPTGVTAPLYGAFASSSGDVWVVGAGGTVLRWCGNAFEVVDVPTVIGLKGVWGTSDSDVWIVGGNPVAGALAMHFNGSDWSEESPPGNSLQDIHGLSPNDAWAIGDELFHWNGTTWLPVDGLPSFGSRVQAVSENRAYVGTGAEEWGIYLWDGVAFSPLQGPSTMQDLVFVNGVLFILSDGMVVFYDGNSWWNSNVTPTTTARAIAGTSETDVWLLTSSSSEVNLLRFSGLSWTKEATLLTVDGSNWRDIAVTSTDVWVVGGNGRVLRHRR